MGVLSDGKQSEGGDAATPAAIRNFRGREKIIESPRAAACANSAKGKQKNELSLGKSSITNSSEGGKGKPHSMGNLSLSPISKKPSRTKKKNQGGP